MRKKNKTPQLSRTTAHRKALLRNLAQQLIEYGQIQTTLAKAKALQPFFEPLVTKANKPNALRTIAKIIYKPQTAQKLIQEVAPRYKNRPGGYTRIVKLGSRKIDSVQEAIITLVNES